MIEENIELDEDTIKFSETLNQDIWDGEELKPNVYLKLLEIASAFIGYLDFSSLDIADIQFTGSMANFNFSEDSDIDLHIIAKFDDDIDETFMQDYFNAKKTIFNSTHDISIYGHPVELYVENVKNPAKSGGKYSLLKDKWLIKPEQITLEIEDVIDSPKYLQYVHRIESVLDSEFNSDDANIILDELYVMRKNGLAKGGELSEDNLIFKKLRSNGYIQKLRDYINQNYDKNLSLP